MIIVHETFICKPGSASKLAKLFKEAMEGNKDLVHVMTDMTGQYNRVIMVTTYVDLAAFAERMEDYEKDRAEMKKVADKMAGYQDMYLTGSREIFRVW